MTEAKSNGILVGATLVKEAELWMGAQGDVLSGVETMITGWARRQRQAYEASCQSVQKMCEARNLLDLIQAQHQWISDWLNWSASEVRAVGSEIPAMTRMAVERFGQSGNGLQRGNTAVELAPNMSLQRAAAE
jgi:predicted lipoprotein